MLFKNTVIKIIKVFLTAVFLFSCVNVYSDEIVLKNKKFRIDYFKSIEFTDNIFKYYQQTGPNPADINYILTGKYSLIKDNNFIFLTVKRRTYILLYLTDILILYEKDNKNQFLIGTDYSKGGFSVSAESHLFTLDNFKSTSYLKENKISYIAENLENYDLTKPWIEGVKGNGINEKLSFELTGNETNNLIFVNGYFDPVKLYLYKDNNRIKKIKIRGISKEFEITYRLEDYFNLQMIILPEFESKFEVTILDIYNGNKYNDTCISGIFTNYYYALKNKD